MVRIVISAVLLVLLAVLVTFNLSRTASFSLFGIPFEGVPVMAIALVSFAVGVVFSLILYLGRSLHQKRKKDLEHRHRELTRREKELDERSAADAAAAETSKKSGKQEEHHQQTGKPRGLLARLKSLW